MIRKGWQMLTIADKGGRGLVIVNSKWLLKIEIPKLADTCEQEQRNNRYHRNLQFDEFWWWLILHLNLSVLISWYLCVYVCVCLSVFVCFACSCVFESSRLARLWLPCHKIKTLDKPVKISSPLPAQQDIRIQGKIIFLKLSVVENICQIVENQQVQVK